MNSSGFKAALRERLPRTLYSRLSRVYKSFDRCENDTAASIPDSALAETGEPFASALRSMYSGEPQTGGDGARYALDAKTRISVKEGICLYRLCRERKVAATLEIGFAYGFSTLYFLAALAANSAARHVAVDPNENGSWHGIGARKVQEVGMRNAFRLVAEPSIVAIPQLMREGSYFDVVFVDGNHRFDDVLVDFTLAALVCKQGGLVILDDMYMPSIRKVVSFVRRNREDFVELPTPVDNISVFHKTGEDLRVWTHFEDFE